MAILDSELDEIRNYLEKSENPLIFFDDDHDGLSSYLLIKKNYDKCHGVVVKGGMKDSELYFRKIEEYNPDCIFVLDRAEISQEMIDSVNVPVIWIDHHPVLERKKVKYFNPRIHEKTDSRPVSYWCYKLVNNNSWIAMVGSIGDYFIPEFIEEFEYKDLFEGKNDIESILFNSKFGNLIKVFNFLLKGSTTEVKKNINFLLKIESPYELLNQDSSKGRFLFNYYKKINKEYEKLLSNAKKNPPQEKIFLFVYPDDKLSLSAALSTELKYTFPDKLVIVARQKEDFMAVSLRSNDLILPPLVKKALEGLNGYGGGHDHAVGANISREDFMKFIANLRKDVEK